MQAQLQQRAGRRAAMGAARPGAARPAALRRPASCAGPRRASKPSTLVRASSSSSPPSAAADSSEFPAQVCVVLGTQWGDEGKGKLVDILAQQYDVVCRAQVSYREIGRTAKARDGGDCAIRRAAAAAAEQRTHTHFATPSHHQNTTQPTPNQNRAAPTRGTPSTTTRATSTPSTSSPLES